jgi:hypothetical protein
MLHPRVELVGPAYRGEQTGRELVFLLRQSVAVGCQAVHSISELRQCSIHLRRPVATECDREAMMACKAPWFGRHIATVRPDLGIAPASNRREPRPCRELLATSEQPPDEASSSIMQ